MFADQLDSAMAALLATADAARMELAINVFAFMYIVPVWIVNDLDYQVTAILQLSCQFSIPIFINDLKVPILNVLHVGAPRCDPAQHAAHFQGINTQRDREERN